MWTALPAAEDARLLLGEKHVSLFKNAQVKRGLNQHRSVDVKTHQFNPAEDIDLKMFNDVNIFRENLSSVEFPNAFGFLGVYF